MKFNLAKPVRIVTSWQEAKEIEDKNAVELYEKGEDAKFIAYELAGSALKVKQLLDSLKQQN